MAQSSLSSKRVNEAEAAIALNEVAIAGVVVT